MINHLIEGLFDTMHSAHTLSSVINEVNTPGDAEIGDGRKEENKMYRQPWGRPRVP